MIQQTFLDFFAYIKNPYPFIKEEEDRVFHNLLFPLLLIGLIFAFFSVGFISALEHLKWIKPLPEFDLFELKDRKILLFLSIVFLAPLIEEIIFRYQLKNWYIAFLAWAIVLSFVYYKFIYEQLLITIAIFITIISIPFYLENRKRVRVKFFRAIFPLHFYITAIVFGLVHISNYNKPFQYGWAIILLVLPQLFIGIILGYVRMRFGLKNAIIFHSAYNFIPALGLLAGY